MTVAPGSLDPCRFPQEVLCFYGNCETFYCDFCHIDLPKMITELEINEI